MHPSNRKTTAALRALALRREWAPMFSILAILVFAGFLYGDLLFSSSNQIVSHLNGDTCSQFVSWRMYGFGELAKGNMPFWNPYVFSGSPFIGNIQSAMLYPVNVALYLVLPLAKAINAEIVFHLLLAGYSTMAWVRNRGAGWMAAVLASAVVMAGAPVCMRVNLGQLNVIAVFAWLPLTLLAVDKLLERVSLGWMLLGIFAVTMQLLAGYPPVAYNSAFTIGLYCVLRLARHPNRARSAAALAIIAVAPITISAVQIAAGYDAMREGLRSEGASLEFASSWSLPPENLLTAFAPLIFGDYTHVNYWGRWCLWDVCVFIGVGAFFLLIYGAIYAPRQTRKFSGVVLLVLLLAALGRYTPFYTILYYCVPELSIFRAPSKFLLPALVFAAMLIALGTDEYLARPKRTRQFAAGAGLCAVLLLGLALYLTLSPTLLDKPGGAWTVLVDSVRQSNEAYWWEDMTDLNMVKSVEIAAASAFAGGATCVTIALLFWRSDKHAARVALVVFSMVEVVVFARYVRVTVSLDTLASPALERLRADDPGDYRELQAKSINPNWRRNYPAMIHMKTAWGYDPMMLKRYATFFAAALGGKEHKNFLLNDVELSNILDPISMALMTGIFHFEFEPRPGIAKYPIVRMPPLFRLMRCKYVYFWPEPSTGILGGVEGIYQVRDPFPRASIYRDYRVVAEPEEMLTRLTAGKIDLDHTLMLESEPYPRPASVSPAAMSSDTVAVHDDRPGIVRLEATLATPGILLLTDAYSRGWKATALPGSAQTGYRILPADYAFQAIPLGAGHHRIQLRYAPAIVSFAIGVSSIATLGYVIACAVWFLSWRRGSRERQ